MDKRSNAAPLREPECTEKYFSSTKKEEQGTGALLKAAALKNAEPQQKLDTGKATGLSKDRNTEDLVLWAKIKAGEMDALGSLYDQYIDILYPYGFSLLNDKVLVMDCIHDLFMDIFKYRKKLTDNPQVKFYLLSSLKRKLFKKRKNTISVSDPASEKHLFVASMFENSAEKKLIEIENVVDNQRLVRKAVGSLTNKQKVAVELKFYQGKSYEEIAEQMNVSIETSRTLIYRSITSLRKKIAAGLFSFFL